MASKNIKFSERLECIISNSGLGNPEFAEKAKIGYSTLMGYLGKNNYGRVPEWDILTKIAEFSKCSIDWLLTGKESTSLKESYFPKDAEERYEYLKNIECTVKRALKKDVSPSTLYKDIISDMEKGIRNLEDLKKTIEKKKQNNMP